MSAVAIQPSIQADLTRPLSAILGATRSRPLLLLDRRALNEGTFAGEVVECRLGTGRAHRLFCKHGPVGKNGAHGHRGGLNYESDVYRYLSRHSQLPLVRFQGSYGERRGGYCWLVLDHLNGCERIHLTADPEAAMMQAARWIGTFHAEQEVSCRLRPPGRLNHYDKEYYLGWARRARRFSRPLQSQFPWIDRLYIAYQHLTDELLRAPRTIVHGEFYPKNILLHQGVVRPVDWESAAIGVGEIDLATLTEGWTQQVTRRCELEYRQARWPDGAPAESKRTLAICRLYVHLRWLGDRPDWTVRKSAHWHFKQLHKLGRQLRVIE